MAFSVSHNQLCLALKEDDFDAAYRALKALLSHSTFTPDLLKSNNLPNLDDNSYNDMSLLHLALNDYDRNDKEILKMIQLLVEHGADIFEPISQDINFNGKSLFELAIKKCNNSVLEYFIKDTLWGEKIHDVANEDMQKLFWFTATYSNVETLEFLTPYFLDSQINYESPKWGNALMGAVMGNNYDTLVYLSENFNLNAYIKVEDDLNLLMYASEADDSQILSYLLGHYHFNLDDVNYDGENVLFCSLRNNFPLNYYKLMSSHKWDMKAKNYHDEDLLSVAYIHKNWDILHNLITQENINLALEYNGIQGCNLLINVSSEAPVEIIQTLVNLKCFDVLAQTEAISEYENLPTNAFWEAARGKNYQVMNYFLKQGYFMDLDTLMKAQQYASIEERKKEDGLFYVKEEKEKIQKSLLVIHEYLPILLEKQRLEQGTQIDIKNTKYQKLKL